MALANKCDRCGKLYEHYPVTNQPGVYNAIGKYRKGLNGQIEFTQAAKDLCPDCMALFETFIKNEYYLGYDISNATISLNTKEKNNG